MEHLEHALVRGEYRTRGAFQEENRQVLERVARLRDKARRSELLDSEALLTFFDERLPAEEGEQAGLQRGRDESLRALRASPRGVLRHRGLTLETQEEARLEGCLDMDTLQRWLTQSLTASNAAEVLR